MTSDDNPKKKKRRLIGIISSLVSLAVMVYVTIAIISGRDFNWPKFSGLFSSRNPVGMVDEYHFEVGQRRVFADLGGSVAAVGTLGVQVLDFGGTETLREPFRMSTPAISAANRRAVAFDIGGTFVRVFDEKGIFSAFETDGAIVSASINKNGWFCVCTQEGGGYRGVVTVYNNKGKSVFRAFLGSGYVLSSVLSPDNKNLAVLNLTDGGSRITFYNGLSKEEPGGTFDLPDELILDMRFIPDGKLIAVTTRSLIVVDISGGGGELYGFSGKRLGAYLLEDDFIALHLLDYSVGFGGQLITLGPDGRSLGELITDRELISISSSGGYLAILRGDGYDFFNSALEELPASGETVPIVDADRILVLEYGAALATGDHSAITIRAANTES